MTGDIIVVEFAWAKHPTIPPKQFHSMQGEIHLEVYSSFSVKLANQKKKAIK